MAVTGWGRSALALFVLGTNAWAGYTHYFTWRQKPDPQALHECIVDMSRVIAARWNMLAGIEGDGKPDIKSLDLVFNGIGDDGHEPFVFPGRFDQHFDDDVGLPPSSKPPPGFNFCKTAGKPYDEVVTACLLVARDHFPRSVLAISSDGRWIDGDWSAGAALYSSVFWRTAKDPAGGEVTDNSSAVNVKDVLPQSGISTTQVLLGAAFLLLLLWLWKG